MRTYQDQLEEIIIKYLASETRLHKHMSAEELDILERLRYRKKIAKLLQSPEKHT